MAVKLRNYKASDYTQLKTNLQIAELHYDDMDSEELIRRMIGRDSESIIIAEDNGKVIGSAYFIDMGFAAMLWRLNVIQEYRKKGIGEEIIKEVKKRAKKRGFTQLHFLVNDAQERLVNYYQKMGSWKGNLWRWMGFDL